MSAGIPVCGAGMENLRYSDSSSSDARCSLLPLPLIPTSPSTMLSCFRRRRRRCGTSNTQGLGELGPSRHRLSFTEIPLQVSLDVVSRRLCQPPRRVLDMVVVPAGNGLCHFCSTFSDRFQTPKKAKSTSNVSRSAQVPLAGRCDAGPWRVRGDESRARSGAERRCARCAFNLIVFRARF